MWKKIINSIYYLLILLSVLLFLMLIISPRKRLEEFGAYDTEKDIRFNDFNSPIEEVITIKDKPIFRFMYFLEEGKYDNLFIGFYKLNGDKIFEMSVPEYTSNMMFFEFPPLKKGKYLLRIIDEDGDPIPISVASSDGNAYLKGDNKHTIRLIFYYSKDHYFYLWYPLFMFTFLMILFPFIRGDYFEKK